MIKKIKPLMALFLSIIMLALIGCSNNDSTPDETTTNTPTTKEEYNTYLTERYNYYFNNPNLYPSYDVYKTGFDYTGTYDEFITSYNTSYSDFKTNLESLKKDLETNVVKGTAEVDKLNQEVIASIDNSISATNDYTSNFATKTKDFATFSKEEVIKGLQDIGKLPYDAGVQLNKLVSNAKNNLGL